MSNLAELKRRYGQNMVFCGAIDTHRVLPYGTPDDVRQEVRRVIAPGAGRRVHGGVGAHDHERRARREHPGDGGCRGGVWTVSVCLTTGRGNERPA